MTTRLGPEHDQEMNEGTNPADGGPQTMAELLAEAEQKERTFRPLRPGETVEGTVAGITGDKVLVDLAGRSAGVLSLREANAGQGQPLEVGDMVFALVVQPEGPQGHAVLSLRRARGVRRWQELAEKQRTGEVVTAPVVEANRGGVVVDVGVRGFVPPSQLASLGALDRPPVRDGIANAVRSLVGKDLTLKVIEVDPQRDRLILSEKAATRDLRRQKQLAGDPWTRVGTEFADGGGSMTPRSRGSCRSARSPASATDQRDSSTYLSSPCTGALRPGMRYRSGQRSG